MNRVIWILLALNALGGIGHHVDHTLRHNVGWPLNEHANGYTFTLLIYPTILVGAILSRRGLLGPGFWAIFSGASLIFTTLVHFGPNAPDPPSKYAASYGSSVFGALAVVWLALMLIVMAFTVAYCAMRWAGLRQQSRRAAAHTSAT